MLPFDLDLASSGFVDAHGQRPGADASDATQTERIVRFLAHCKDIRVKPDCPQPTCCSKVPQGLAASWVVEAVEDSPTAAEELSSLIGQRIQAQTGAPNHSDEECRQCV